MAEFLRQLSDSRTFRLRRESTTQDMYIGLRVYHAVDTHNGIKNSKILPFLSFSNFNIDHPPLCT